MLRFAWFQASVTAAATGLGFWASAAGPETTARANVIAKTARMEPPLWAEIESKTALWCQAPRKRRNLRHGHDDTVRLGADAGAVGRHHGHHVGARRRVRHD